jgi:hypothetical protein
MIYILSQVKSVDMIGRFTWYKKSGLFIFSSLDFSRYGAPTSSISSAAFISVPSASNSHDSEHAEPNFNYKKTAFLSFHAPTCRSVTTLNSLP